MVVKRKSQHACREIVPERVWCFSDEGVRRLRDAQNSGLDLTGRMCLTARRLPSPSSIFHTALAETRQGWNERAYQRGLDGFRSNTEDSQEEGEGSKFDGVSNCLAISLTAKFVARVATTPNDANPTLRYSRNA
jgi:hypothetical protein